MCVSRRKDARTRDGRTGGIAELVGPSREDELKAAIVEGLAPYRADDGSYRLRNQYHYLIARA